MKIRLVKTRNLPLIADASKISGIEQGKSQEDIIDMVVENDYSSILEHIVFTFDIAEISVALSRDLLEHRIAAHTARSTRFNDERGFKFHLPQELEGQPIATAIYQEAMKSANASYKKLRDLGIGKEEARYVLPMALGTHYVLTINARSLINLLGLRLCVRAAPEFQTLAKKLYKLALIEYPSIFARVWCRGFNTGVCPENDARPLNCPFRFDIPTRHQVKVGYESAAKQIREDLLGGAR